MIGRLRGTLAGKQAPSLLLDVNGVGYEIEAPMSTFYDLPAVGAQVTLYTHLVVREDAHLLFGFATDGERRMFRGLIRISGVGAKLALAILSSVSAQEFARCVLDGDAAALTRVPGVGKKTAERLIIEMRDRLADWQSAAATPAAAGGGSQAPGANIEVSDAVNALVALGYKPPEASRMVRGVDSAGLASEEIIRRALQAAAK